MDTTNANDTIASNTSDLVKINVKDVNNKEVVIEISQDSTTRNLYKKLESMVTSTGYIGHIVRIPGKAEIQGSGSRSLR